MHKALHHRDDVDRQTIWISFQREEEDLPASKTALTHRYNGSKTS